MLHIPTSFVFVWLGLVAFVGIGVGAMSEKRRAEKERKKLDTRRIRQEKWQKRKEAVLGTFIPWKRER